MKETVEEAAMKYSCYALAQDGFEKGAEWRSKQSPWISVEERLPDTDNGQSLYEVLVKTRDGRYSVVANISVEHMAERGEVIEWMPIPE